MAMQTRQKGGGKPSRKAILYPSDLGIDVYKGKKISEKIHTHKYNSWDLEICIDCGEKRLVQ